MIDIMDLCLKAVNHPISKEVDQIEAYSSQNRTITIVVEKGEIKTAKITTTTGIGIRAIKDKAIGFSHTSNPEKYDKTVEEACSLAKAGQPDKDFKSLPSDTSKTHVEKLYDEKIRDLTVEEAMEMVKQMINAAKISDKVYSIGGDFKATVYETAIANSLGVNKKQRGTYISIFSEVVAKDGSETASGFEFNFSRHLKMIDPEWVGREGATIAVKSLDNVSPEKGKYPVIIEPTGLGAFIGFLVSSAANAENVQYKRSFLAGKLGQRIAGENVNIYDDGTIPGLSGSTEFDGEGVHTRKVPIIENGILKNYLHNSYTAAKAGVESTGHAARSYSSVPYIGAHNIVIEKGIKKEELLDVKKGILLKYTGDLPNLANGEFSGLILSGFLIENGEITKGLKQTMCGIHLLDLINNIDAVGDDVRDVGGLYTPSIRIKRALITSRKG